MATADQKYPNRLRQSIKQSGFTIEHIALETEIPLRTLFDYCSGRVPIPRERLEGLAQALGYPVDYLVPSHPSMTNGFLLQSDESERDHTWIATGVTNYVDQLRRTFLQQLFNTNSALFFLSHGNLVHTDAWERVSLALHDPYRTDEATLVHLETVTTTYWELYRSAIAKVDLLSSVLGHLFTVTQLLRSSQPLAVQNRLCCIASNTAQILGEIYFDMNDNAAAQTYYQLAIKTAQEVDNHTLKAIALGRNGFLAMYNHEYEKALPVLREAFSLAENTTTGKTKSWLVMMEAEALSNLQKKKECLSVLEKTEQVFEQDRSATGEDKNWTGFSRSTMVGYKGICYVHLQLPGEAQTMLQTALDALPSGPTRRKALMLTDLATTYVQQKEIEQACIIATQALLCTAQTKSTRALTKLVEFQRGLHEWKNVASVKKFQKHLKLMTA